MLIESQDAPLFDGTDQRKLAEAALRSITLSTSRARGDEFFQVLVRDLASALDMCYVVASEIIAVDGVESSHTLALWAGNDYLPNITYALEYTPCREVVDQYMCFHSEHIQQKFPLDIALVEMKAESYVGMRMMGTDGSTLGILVALDTRPINEEKRYLALSLLSIFSARCAAELQHRNRETELEAMVAQRTRALESARDMLVQREKLAALGSLVAGVAHVMNTPVGNALTCVTTLKDFAEDLGRGINDEKPNRKALSDLTQHLIEGAILVERNLHRASELLNNFKMLTYGNQTDHASELELLSYIIAIGLAHKPELEKRHASILTAIPKTLKVWLPPGALSQIISNLIMNSLVHGFVGRAQGMISISADPEGADLKDLRIQYSDDGLGVTEPVLRHIFDPFFTTKMGQGGSGLGMHVVYTLLQELGGTIVASSSAGTGLVLNMTIPNCIV